MKILYAMFSETTGPNELLVYIPDYLEGCTVLHSVEPTNISR